MNMMCCMIFPDEKAGSVGSADRNLAIGVMKSHTLGYHAFEVRGAIQIIAQRINITPTLLIGEKPQNIGRVVHFLLPLKY
jgi:hypothetical protein